MVAIRFAVVYIGNGSNVHGTNMRGCWFKVAGAGGVAFLALASGAANLEKYLYIPGAFWILGGTFVVGAWAYEAYCVGAPTT